MKWTGNWIRESGATAISESLKTNTTLTILWLSGDGEIKKTMNEKEMKW